jgi:thiol-disulfide isomerase/thioredoxin
MHKPYYLFLLLIAFSCLGQQNPPPPPLETSRYFEQYVQNKPVPVLKGIIRNVPPSVKKTSGALEIWFFTLDMDGTSRHVVKVLPDGSFETRMDHALPFQKVGLNIYELSQKRIYVTHDIFIDIDYEKLSQDKPGAVTYTGKDAGLNKVMDEYSAFYQTYSYRTHLRSRTEQLESDSTISDFNGHWTTLNREIDSLKTAFIDAHPTAGQCEWLLNDEILADRYTNLLGYHRSANLELNAAYTAMLDNYKPRFQSQSNRDFYYSLTQLSNSIRQKQAQQNLTETFLENLLTDKNTLQEDQDAIKSTITVTKDFYLRERRGENKQADADKVNKSLLPLLAKYKAFLDSYTKAFIVRFDSVSYRKYLKNQWGTERADILMAYNLPNHTQVGIDKFNQYYKKAIPQFETALVKTFVTEYVARVATTPANIRILKATEKSTGQDNKHFTYNKTVVPNKAVLYSNANLSGVTLFKQLTQYHKNKVLFIDMWGTWCVACLQEFPNSEILQAKTDAANVEFIYLCNNSPQKDCLLDIVKYKLKGTNVLLTPRQTDQLLSLFKGSGFPTYVMVDKRGNIHYNARQIVEDPVKGSTQLNLLAKAK